MNYDFLMPGIGRCNARVWARGAYGFSVPKKVEIVTPTGQKATYLYRNSNEMDSVELNARTIAKIAIFHFLDNSCVDGTTMIGLNSNMPRYEGELMRAKALLA